MSIEAVDNMTREVVSIRFQDGWHRRITRDDLNFILDAWRLQTGEAFLPIDGTTKGSGKCIREVYVDLIAAKLHAAEVVIEHWNKMPVGPLTDPQKAAYKAAMEFIATTLTSGVTVKDGEP